MQRSKVEALADHTLYVIIHNNGIAVYHTAVKYAVADRRNLICVCDHAMVCILQSFHNKADRYGMIWHRLLKHELVLARLLVGQLDPSIPIRSQRPFAITFSFSISISWYFKEELPQLITKIFMIDIFSFYIFCTVRL